MLKKVVRDVIILFCFVSLWASTSRSAMKFLLEKRDVDKWWGVFQNNHGDLASMSHLDYVNKFYDPRKKYLKKSDYSGLKKTVIFIHGDSNTWRIGDSVFTGVCDYKFIGWNSKCNYHLDSSKRNILIIEIGERLLRDYFNTTEIIDELVDTAMIKKSAFQPFNIFNRASGYRSSVGDLKFDLFFNKNINQNLECNLFNYGFIMPVFGFKAAINYYLFDRASGDVIISDDKQYLFFKETCSSTARGSSLSPLAPGELDNLVNNFNKIYDYYKQSGFDKVYLSIVPSTVTLMQPKGYNNLIPLIQTDPRLKMPLIDIYSFFKKSNRDYFLHGDTHWNTDGKQKWIDMVNEALAKDQNNKLK